MVNLPNAPRTRQQQFQFLRDAHAGPDVWKRLCLSLARQAPGLPAVFPTANAAAHGTPQANRVTKVADLRRGMVAYFGKPGDANPADHIVTVAGWRDPKAKRDLDNLLTWTNDAVDPGSVDLVRASFFPEKWDAPFMWGATSLNGFDLPGYDTGRPKPSPASVGPAFQAAMQELRKEIRKQRRLGHTGLVNALVKDLEEMKETRRRFPARG